jgi:NADH-quinone oxidoreductase subunit N
VAEAIQQIHATASLLVPEIILLATMCALFLGGPLLVTDAGDAAPGLRHRWSFLSLAALAFAWVIWIGGDPAAAYQGALFQVDTLLWYTRGLSLSAGIVLVLILWNQVDDGYAAEAHACLLAIMAGTNLVAAANDLVSLFLALELVSIPTYVLLYLSRRDRLGSEATVKYFLLSIFASALVLYGMCWVYGETGTTNLVAVASVGEADGVGMDSPMLPLAFALLLAGLCFRITAVPFHFYAPDVFQGTTASNAALLSYVPKVIGFVALLRLLPATGAAQGLTGWVPQESARWLLAVLAVVTMSWGNLMALRQKHLYRLMAYSSVAHAGYMLVGLAVGDVEPAGGTDALLFYLAAYGLMTIGVFAMLSTVALPDEPRPRPLGTDDDLRGLSGAHPAVAVLLAICLFSLTGLPPTAGFLGKLNLFLAAWSDGSTLGRSLASIMALNAGIAAWYYLRLIAVMFLEPAPGAAREMEALAPGAGWPAWLAGAICTTATVAIFLAPQWLWNSVP